jgi:hypothetical protein
MSKETMNFKTYHRFVLLHCHNHWLGDYESSLQRYFDRKKSLRIPDKRRTWKMEKHMRRRLRKMAKDTPF